MPEPPRFDDNDPMLERIREIALALPGAAEKISHSWPAFYTVKVFAWYGASQKDGPQWTEQPQSVSVLLPEPERTAVSELPFAFTPGYIGPYGWIGLKLDESTDWDEIAELLEESYRQTAPKTLVRKLN